MGVVGADIKWYYSGDGTQAGSLGGAITGNQITTAELHNIFGKVTGAEGAAGVTKYRLIYVKNTHATDPAELMKVFFLANTPDPADVVSMSLGEEGLNGVAETIATENDAPVGEVFTQPSDYDGGLDIGTMEADDFYPIWLKLVIAPSQEAKDEVTFSIKAQGDTTE